MFGLQVLDDHLVQVPAGVATAARVVVPDADVVQITQGPGCGHQELDHRAATELLWVTGVSSGQVRSGGAGPVRELLGGYSTYYGALKLS